MTLRIAIIGSGPAGFYTAEHLLKREEPTVEVDMFDRLPTPYGLVRGGVAPDHPKIKSVIRVYEKTAAMDGFRFFGNVHLGRDLSAADLAEHYHAVIYAYGAETDRHLGIPGEDLPGSAPATAFVGWYNAHPDYADLEWDLSHERVVVVGNGNVATDVTRMLALTLDELRATDVADHAIDVLAESGVREIVVLGRRGPAQAAFTNPEVRELGEIVDADCIVDPAQMELDPLSAAYLESDEADITSRKNVEILTELSKRKPEGKRKRVVLRFLVSPVEILGEGKVEQVVIGRNELVGEGSNLRAKDTGKRETLDAGLVLRSVGYRGIPVDGLPFDEGRGVIPNEGGRVIGADGGEQIPGAYVTGWIKRGPSGVIGTNKKDGHETVDLLLEDAAAGKLPEPASPEPRAIEELLAERKPDHVTFDGWRAIDAAEVERGKPHGRPRVKFTRIDEMLDAAGAKRDAVPG